MVYLYIQNLLCIYMMKATTRSLYSTWMSESGTYYQEEKLIRLRHCTTCEKMACFANLIRGLNNIPNNRKDLILIGITWSRAMLRIGMHILVDLKALHAPTEWLLWSRSISTLYYYTQIPLASFLLLWKQGSGSSGSQRINDRSNYHYALSDGGNN